MRMRVCMCVYVYQRVHNLYYGRQTGKIYLSIYLSIFFRLSLID